MYPWRMPSLLRWVQGLESYSRLLSDSRSRPRHDLTIQADAWTVDIAAQPGPKG